MFTNYILVLYVKNDCFFVCLFLVVFFLLPVLTYCVLSGSSRLSFIIEMPKCTYCCVINVVPKISRERELVCAYM